MHFQTQRTCLLAQGKPRVLLRSVCPAALGSLRWALRSSSRGESHLQQLDVQTAASVSHWESEAATVATASVLQDTATPSATAVGDAEAGPGHAMPHSHLQQHAPQHAVSQRHPADQQHLMQQHHHHHLAHHHEQHHNQLQFQAGHAHGLAAEPEAHLLTHASTSAAATAPHSTCSSADSGNGVGSSTTNSSGHAHAQELEHTHASGSHDTGGSGQVLEVYRSGSTAPLVLGLGHATNPADGVSGGSAAFTLAAPRASPAPDTRGPRGLSSATVAAATAAFTAATLTAPATGVLSPLASPTSSTEWLSSVDSDSEMCVLVPDPEGGDIQMVCESDPTHPISLAEEAVLHPLVPTSLLQDIERKLEADLSTIAITIVFAMGFICLEFGVNDLIEIFFGHSVVSDLTCIGIGLVVVFGVKVSKRPLLRLDRWS